MAETSLFTHTLSEIQNRAPEELVQTMTEQMLKMKTKFVHTAKAVDDCLPVLQDKPSLLDVLVVSYILNGSILLKHVVDEQEDQDNSEDIEKLINDFKWDS